MAYDTFTGLPLDQSIQGAVWDNGGVTWGTPTYLAGNGADAAKITSGLQPPFEIFGNFLPPDGSVGVAVFFRAGAGRDSTANAATVTMHGNGSTASPSLLSGVRAAVGGYGKLSCRDLVGAVSTEANFVPAQDTDYCLELSQPDPQNKRQYVTKIYSVVGGARGALLATTPVLTVATERPATARMSQMQASGNFTNVAFSRVETLDAPAADTTAPTLSSPTAAATGANSASGTVTTNEANGTLYCLVNSSTTATAAAVKAGASKPVTATGSQSVTVNGLTASTGYRIHYLHRDAAGNDSAVSSSAQFTTDAAPPAGDTTPPVLEVPTATATGPSTATGTVATDEAGGLLYRFASTAATGVTAAQIKAANLTQTVDATGSQNVLFAGLAQATTYYAYYLQRDAAGNDSAIARSSAFTTQTAPVTGTVTVDFPLSWEIQASTPPGGGDAEFVRSKVRTISIKAAPLTFEGGPYWNLTNPRRPVAVIDPNATIDITFNWTDLLADIADQIAEVQFDLSGLSNKGAYRDGAFATIFVSDATGSPHITCRITTASTPPRIEDRTVYFNVEQQ